MFLQTKPLAGVAAVALFAIASPASAATLVQYDFNGNAGNEASEAASFTATNLTAQLFTRGPGVGATGGGNSLNSNNWSTAANDYYTFGFSVASGYTATVNQLVFGSQASGTGPRNFNVLASTDGGTTFLTVGSFVNIGAGSPNNQTITIDPVTGTSSLIFRFALANATSVNGGTVAAGGTFRVQNFGAANSSANPFTIDGTVAQIPTGVVPEPATWAMMIGGIGFAGGALRRRRSVSVRFA